jgi:cytochrome c biogenesis protein CcmG/thiol:disulfide interchange protein DsbE
MFSFATMKQNRRMRSLLFKSGMILLIWVNLFGLTQGKEKKSLAPHFEAENLDGKKVELKELLKEGPVLISFWATWCKPCIKELNQLQKVYKKYKEKGFEILAIDVDGPRSISKVKPKVKGLKWEFPVLWDKSKKIYRKYHVLGIPHTVLIDPSGKIRYTHTTYRPGDEEVIKKKIEELLDEHNPIPNEEDKEKSSAKSEK